MSEPLREFQRTIELEGRVDFFRKENARLRAENEQMVEVQANLWKRIRVLEGRCERWELAVRVVQDSSRKVSKALAGVMPYVLRYGARLEDSTEKDEWRKATAKADQWCG